MSKIAILYICTGKYDVFWEGFYKSSEKYFLKNIEKHYYVFTDSKQLYDQNRNDKIHKVYQENLGWPNNTLMRFNMFSKVTNELKAYDYIFFMNANLLFVAEVGEEFLIKDKDLLVVKHPYYYNKHRSEFTYDNNVESLAYIRDNEGDIYIAGGLNGGKTTAFLKLIETLRVNIEKDLENGVIALWHDESHINRYIINRNDIHVLGPEYLYPEGKEFPFKPKIIIRDKNIWGGHAELRGIKEYKIKRIIKIIKNRIKKYLVKWY